MFAMIELAVTGLVVIFIMAGYTHAIGASKRPRFSTTQEVKNWMAKSQTSFPSGLRPVHIILSGTGHHALVQGTIHDAGPPSEPNGSPPHSTVLLYAMGSHWNTHVLQAQSIKSLGRKNNSNRLLIRFNTFTLPNLRVSFNNAKQKQDWLKVLTPFLNDPTPDPSAEPHHV